MQKQQDIITLRHTGGKSRPMPKQRLSIEFDSGRVQIVDLDGLVLKSMENDGLHAVVVAHSEDGAETKLEIIIGCPGPAIRAGADGQRS